MESPIENVNTCRALLASATLNPKFGGSPRIENARANPPSAAPIWAGIKKRKSVNPLIIAAANSASVILKWYPKLQAIMSISPPVSIRSIRCHMIALLKGFENLEDESSKKNNTCFMLDILEKIEILLKSRNHKCQ